MTYIKVVKTLIAVLAATAFGACSDSYPGLSYDSLEQSSSQGQTGTTYEGSRKSIVLKTPQDMFSVKTQTRGMGAFDTLDADNDLRISQAPFYVFAFRDGKYEKSNNKELLSEPDFSRWAYAKDKDWKVRDSLNNHCLLDGDEYNYGLKTHFKNGQLVPEYNGVDYRNLGGLTGYQRFYYSSANAEVPYNFFAYYIDDIKITNLSTARQADRVAYDIEIDGSQNLMCGTSDLRKEIEIAQGKNDTIPPEQSAIYKQWKSLSKTDSTKIKGIGGYCTFAGHRDIHPTINLKYQLARLKIECVPADTVAKKIRVTKVGIASRHKGTMTVASRNCEEVGVVWDNDIDTLFMQDIKKVGDKLVSQPMATTQIQYNPTIDEPIIAFNKAQKNIDAEQNWDKSTVTPLGSSLMVVPADSYILGMNLEMEGKDGNTIHGYAKYPVVLMDDPWTFRAGFEYNVKVLVYGLQEIAIIARPGFWKQGGTIEIDPDKQ